MHPIVELLEYTTKETAKHICDTLKELGINYSTGFRGKELMYIFADNGFNHNTMLVSHIDTVDHKKPQTLVVQQAGSILKSNTPNRVLGADDRAGVYAILQILKDRVEAEETLPPVLFCNLEESGGIGVGHFVQKGPDLKDKGIDLFIELDRRGKDEYVVYHDQAKEVHTYVEGFDFEEHFGCYSDIVDLTDEYDIPSVNLSIGYEAQHTVRETLNVDWMHLTINKVKKMLDNPIDKCYDVYANQAHQYYFQPKKPAIPLPTGSWVHNADKLVVNRLITGLTKNEACICGRVWWNCDCGAIEAACIAKLDDLQMDYLMNTLLDVDDGLYQNLVWNSFQEDKVAFV